MRPRYPQRVGGDSAAASECVAQGKHEKEERGHEGQNKICFY